MMDANLNKSFSFENFAYRKNLSKYALQSKTRWKLIEGGMRSNRVDFWKKQGAQQETHQPYSFNFQP